MEQEIIYDNSYLTAKNATGLCKKQRFCYYLYNISLIALSNIVLCLCSFMLAYGPTYSPKIFSGYISNPAIFALNLVPIILLFCLFFAIFGKSHIAYLLNSLVILGLTVSNFFLVKFRDDPLMFSDVLYIREAMKISEEGYNYEVTASMVVAVSACIVCTIILARFCRYTARISRRYLLVIIAISVSITLSPIYFNDKLYDHKIYNNKHINRWSSTQFYVSKGFVYPFIHSAGEVLNLVPEDYDSKAAQKVLSAYTPKDIPKDKRVNIIGIMLEAFCDLETIGVSDIDDSVYNLYRIMKEENYSGTLVTNIFAGGTIDTERAFLTGMSGLEHCRRDTNSYVRYLNRNGYTSTGSHPSEMWFYNRKNVNSYLGFNDYLFAEGYYEDKFGTGMRLDGYVVDDFYRQYIYHLANFDSPYFGFHVTYQGHGPYTTDGRDWGTGENPLYLNDKVTEQTGNILNNYLGSLKDSGWRIFMMYDKIKKIDEPTVMVIFGDHKPWLGDSNSVYEELGINLDLSTKEGFMNYYATEYVIIANDAAKEILACEFKGEGSMISPQFLMNELFSLAGYTGDEYMQYTNDVRKQLPVINDDGVIDKDGNYYPIEELDGNLLELYKQFKRVEHYKRTEKITK